jgi:hypothetical protein
MSDNEGALLTNRFSALKLLIDSTVDPVELIQLQQKLMSAQKEMFSYGVPRGFHVDADDVSTAASASTKPPLYGSKGIAQRDAEWKAYQATLQSGEQEFAIRMAALHGGRPALI